MEYQISHRSQSLAEETRGNTRANAHSSRGITRGAGSVGIIAGVSVPTPEPKSGCSPGTLRATCRRIHVATHEAAYYKYLDIFLLLSIV